MLRQLYNDVEIWRAERLARKTRKLHLAPPPICVFEYKVQDIETDKLIKKYRQSTHSYTRNYLNFLATNVLFCAPPGTTYEDGSLKNKQVSGTMYPATSVKAYVLQNPWTESGHVESVNFGIFGNTGDANRGIVIGTSSTAESLNDFALGAKIANGTAAGQFNYQLTVKDDPIFNAPSKKWSRDWTRSFHNNSGGSITVNEIGVQTTFGFESGTPASYITCILRDVLSSGIVVGAGQKLTITYRFSYIVA